MRILVNGAPHEVAADTLKLALDALGYTAPGIATALDGDFVPAALRAETTLRPGCRVEVVSPMQGG